MTAVTTRNDKVYPPQAVQKLAQDGVLATLRRPAQGFDPGTGSGSGSEQEAIGIKVQPPRGKNTVLPGTNVQAAVLQSMVAGSDPNLSFVPEPNDRLSWGNRSATIRDVQEIASGDLVAAYKLVMQE